MRLGLWKQGLATEIVPMGEPWVILERRYGDGCRNPTRSQLAEAVAELYHEILPDMTEGDYAEHGAGALRYGFDDGPMFVLEINRLQSLTFEEWADQDYERELTSPRIMRAVPEELANQLWMWLAQGKIDRVRSQPWEAP